jgi:hypothetical protein
MANSSHCPHRIRKRIEARPEIRCQAEEPDPRDLMRPFPAEAMRMWPISTRVNKPENDHPSILESAELADTCPYRKPKTADRDRESVDTRSR